MAKKKRGGGGGGSKGGGGSSGSSGGGGGGGSSGGSNSGGSSGGGDSSSGGRSSPIVDEEEEKTSGEDTPEKDPDTGDTTTTRLRDDAESDPMNPQTEKVDVGDSSGGGDTSSKDQPSGEKQPSDAGQTDTEPSSGEKTGSTPFEGGGSDQETGSEKPTESQNSTSPNPPVNQGNDDSTESTVQQRAEDTNDGTRLDQSDIGRGDLDEYDAERVETFDGQPLSETTDSQLRNLRNQADDEAPGPIALAPNPDGQGVTAVVGEDAEEAANFLAEQEAVESIEQDLESQVGGQLERGEDFVVRETDDGGITAEITPEREAEERARAVAEREAREERLQKRTERAESQAIEELNSQLGSESFGEEDVAATTERTEEGDTVVTTRLTDEGERTLTETREKQTFEQVQQNTDADLAQSDVAINVSNNGVSAELTDSGLRAEVAAESDQFTEDDLVVTSDGNVLVDRGDTGAAARALDGSETDIDLDSGERARQLDGSETSLDTPTRQLDGSTDPGTPTRDFLSPLVEFGEETLGVDAPGNGSVLNEAAEADSDAGIPERGEGEIFDGGDVVGGEESEEFFRGSAQWYRENVSGPAGEVAGDLAEQGQTGARPGTTTGALNTGANAASGVEAVLRGRPEDAPATPAERAQRRAGLTQGGVESTVDLFNPGQLGLLGIEAAEVGVAGAQSNPLLGADTEETVEYGQQLAAAGSRAVLGTAAAAEESPNQFAGELIAGTAVGSATETAIRRGLRGGSSARMPGDTTPDVDRGRGSSAGNTELGSGGTGTVLDADTLDESRGVSDPGIVSRARGRIERELDLQGTQPREYVEERVSAQLGFSPDRDRINDNPDVKLTAEDLNVGRGSGPSVRSTGGGARSGQRGRQGGGFQSSPSSGGTRGAGARTGRDRSVDWQTDSDPSVDPALREVVEPDASPADDISSRARTQRRQNRGTFDGRMSDRGRARAETENAQRRRERSQEPQVVDPTPDLSTESRSSLSPLGGVAGTTAGLLGRQEDAQSPAVVDGTSIGVDTSPSVDTGLDAGPMTGSDVDARTRTDLETRTDTRQATGADTMQRTDTRLDQSPISVGTEVTGPRMGIENRVDPSGDSPDPRIDITPGGDSPDPRRFEIPELRFGGDGSDSRRGGGEGRAENVNRELLNPFTGR